MLHVKTACLDLRAGDVIDYDGKLLRCVEPTKGDGKEYVTYETVFEPVAGGEPMTISSSLSWEPTIVSTARDVAARIVEALHGFPPEVRLAAFRHICPKCGGIDCHVHL